MVDIILAIFSFFKQSGKDSVQGNVKQIYAQLDNAIARIKSSSKIRPNEIEKYHKSLVEAINNAIEDVKHKIEKAKSCRRTSQVEKDTRRNGAGAKEKGRRRITREET